MVSGNEIFISRKALLQISEFHTFWDIQARSPKTMATLTHEKWSCFFLNLWFNCSSKMIFFKFQHDFSELGIKVFLENGLGSFKTFLILQI
jgi:hypothetical protein